MRLMALYKKANKKNNKLFPIVNTYILKQPTLMQHNTNYTNIVSDLFISN